MTAPYVSKLSSKDLKNPLLTLRYISQKKLWKPVNGSFSRLISHVCRVEEIRSWLYRSQFNKTEEHVSKLKFCLDFQATWRKKFEEATFENCQIFLTSISHECGAKFPWGVAIKCKWQKNPVSPDTYYYFHKTLIKVFSVQYWRSFSWQVCSVWR